MKSDTKLVAEFAFSCADCGSLIELRTFRAIVESVGQLVVCGQCKRTYLIDNYDAAKALPRDFKIMDTAYPPPVSSISKKPENHPARVHPADRDTCQDCMRPVWEHNPRFE